MRSFRGYRSIRILKLSDNEINKIDENSLQELVHLKHLYLSANNIIRLPSTLFSSNGNLKKLYLKGNPLLISDITPIVVSDSITYLDIAYCNITVLPAEMFAAVPNLVELRLDGNLLTNITTEAFEPLRNLKEIYMESETSMCVSSSFNEFLNYLEKRGIKYYGPSVCSEEWLRAVHSTANLTAPLSTSAVANQTHTELTSVLPRTTTNILETSVPILNRTSPTATVMSVAHNPLFEGVSQETQLPEESTRENMDNNHSPNLAMKSTNTPTIYIVFFCAVLTQVVGSLRYPSRCFVS
jgi:hypothetical protein